MRLLRCTRTRRARTRKTTTSGITATSALIQCRVPPAGSAGLGCRTLAERRAEMSRSIVLYRRHTKRLDARRFASLTERLGLDAKPERSDEALIGHDGT